MEIGMVMGKGNPERGKRQVFQDAGKHSRRCKEDVRVLSFLCLEYQCNNRIFLKK